MESAKLEQLAKAFEALDTQQVYLVGVQGELKGWFMARDCCINTSFLRNKHLTVKKLEARVSYGGVPELYITV